MDELYGFFASRALVSAGFSLAMQSVPELLQLSVNDWASLSSRMDSVNAAVAFVTRPLWANLADSLGRKPCLVVGCLCSGWARIFWSQQPSSPSRYIVYRMVNVIANIPITQATSVMLIDCCGGRTTKLYGVMHRRMWIMLAVVRVLASAWSSRTVSGPLSLTYHGATGSSPSTVNSSSTSPPSTDPPQEAPYSSCSPATESVARATSQLKWAGRLSLLAGIFFLFFSRETLRVKNLNLLFRNPFLVWQDSFLFFFRSPERRKIAPFLLLRAFPNYSMTLGLQLNKLLGFTGEKRARLSMFENAMDIFVPLVLNELCQFSAENMLLSMRVSNFCDFLRLVEPTGGARYFNAVADRLVSSSRDYNAVLKRAQGAHAGEASLEAAVDSLCFPLSILLPRLYYVLSSHVGVSRVFWLIFVVGIINAECYYPYLKRILSHS